MKLYPRSSWTASIPRPSLSADNNIGLPYFDKPPVGIDFTPVGEDYLFIYRNPKNELERLLKKETQNTGFPDIKFNYAIAQNVAGVFVLRGAINKTPKCDDRIKVLVLIGEHEKPTDTLKRNQEGLLRLDFTNPAPQPVLSPGDANVHVFDLIEYLVQHGYYQARNDGVYGPLTKHAVSKFQSDLGFAHVTGVWDAVTYEHTRNLINA